MSDPATLILQDSIASIVREKERVIRSQAKRIEQLESEVKQLRRDRDRLSTKLALLAGRGRIQSAEEHHDDRYERVYNVSAVFILATFLFALPRPYGQYNTKQSLSPSNGSFHGHRKTVFSQVNVISSNRYAKSTELEMNSASRTVAVLESSSEFHPLDPGALQNHTKCFTNCTLFNHENAGRVNTAARIIQHAYRRYRMHKNFARLRSEPERSKRSFERSQAMNTGMESCNAGDEKSMQQCDSCIGLSRAKMGSLRTIDEHSGEYSRVEGNARATREQVLYPDLSDSSDNDSILDTVLEPAFDESSTNFEHLLEAEEAGGADDSFNSEDSQEGEASSSSQCSTLRAGNSAGLSQPRSSTVSCRESSSDGSHVVTLQNLMSDSTYSDSDSVSGDALLTPIRPDYAGSLESCSFGADSFESSDSLSKLSAVGGNIDAFIRFCVPGYSPIWKRKSVHRGSTGSLPDTSSARLSQVSNAGSSEPSELGSSIADVSQSSEEPARSLTLGSRSVTDDHLLNVEGHRHPLPAYEHKERCHGCSLEAIPLLPPPTTRLVPLSSSFCSTGAYAQSDRLRKRVYRIGLNLFNKKPERGVKYLIENRFIDFRSNAVAKFLVSRKGLSRQMIGEYLGTIQKPFNVDVLRCFADEIDLSGLQVDVALRKYQSFFRMPGESQKIERIMEVFANRYCTCNPDQVKKLRTPDTIFLLAFSIIMLNTDQHNRCIKDERRMTINQFIKNLQGIDDGEDVDRDLLAGIYERVRSCEFKPGSDHVTQVAKVEEMIVGKRPQLATPYRRLVCYCRLYEVPDLSRHEKPGSHQRELFLFNDLLVVTKILNKKKNFCYGFRQAFTLHGMAVYLFETQYYKFGVRLTLATQGKVLITLCARTEHDRTKFVEDLKEAILEIDEMAVLESYENRREHTNHGGNGHQGNQHSREVNRHSKDSGVVDVDNLAISHRLSASDCDNRKNSISSSVSDFSERHRTESRGSLDSGKASTGSSGASSCMESSKLYHSQSLRSHHSPVPASTAKVGAVSESAGQKKKSTAK